MAGVVEIRNDKVHELFTKIVRVVAEEAEENKENGASNAELLTACIRLISALIASVEEDEDKGHMCLLAAFADALDLLKKAYEEKRWIAFNHQKWLLGGKS